jgi:hypothetical protein
MVHMGFLPVRVIPSHSMSCYVRSPRLLCFFTYSHIISPSAMPIQTRSQANSVGPGTNAVVETVRAVSRVGCRLLSSLWRDTMPMSI